ncbi:hypothetical protein HIM_08831 [Hirsutella minnesotensis 3608]|uniref:Rhodopsin domain-containing protein n=1 Tax=Hirsutella minnesotensis 3608 TaxID=1043627 RepID=A0A0F7ZH07_9HYPO|nr:hypothetical protein HIM_08831 [Hirsutella minnesotensis 3608]
MLLALCIQLATAILCQLGLERIYVMEEVGNNIRTPPPTFLNDIPIALRYVFITQILMICGLWFVKLNFLIFFYRIFCSASRLYRYLWWAVCGVTALCLGTFLGLNQYTCLISDVAVILGECTSPSTIRLEWIQVQTTSAVDAFNDALIMIFPVAILWRVKISIKKKLYLSFLFLLSLFTMAMAIIRGTISYGRIATDYSQSQNISWLWFWLQMELFVCSSLEPRALGDVSFLHRLSGVLSSAFHAGQEGCACIRAC